MSSKENQDKGEKKKALSDFADSLLATEEEDKQAKKQILREGIEEREEQEKGIIAGSRAITKKLSEIREQADMSAFVGTSGKIKSPKFRRGEFIELLSRELLLIGRDEIKDTGGILSQKKLEQYFSENRTNWELKEDDIQEALHYLDQQNLIAEIEEISDEQTLIYFRPVELSSDTQKLLKAATGMEVSVTDLKTILGWSDERLDLSLNLLVEEGIAIKDGENVYFPGL